METMTRNGILCVEGDWEEGLFRRRSLVPVLHLVNSQWNIPFIHRTASTRDEFRAVISEWLKAKYSTYPILYLGFHGFPGALEIGHEEIPICDLAEFSGKGRGRIVHFGACETLRAPTSVLNQFLKMTQFVAICGFRSEVDWLHSCALEIIILDELSRRSITAKTMHVFRENIEDMAGSLCKKLEFQVWERAHLYPSRSTHRKRR
jgi:hypothetical protein